MDEFFNLKSFHESTSHELLSVENRVRNLIGNVHRGEDGRYKEAILRNMIERFIPPRYKVGTGFIVKKDHDPSRQIDILIIDSNYPILFSLGDFYIVTPNCVRAVIEVKTNIRTNDLSNFIRKTNELGSFLAENQTADLNPFVGIFSFRGLNSNTGPETIERNIKNGIHDECFINHISLNKDIFVKHWKFWSTEHPSTDNFLSVYKLKDLSFSFFIYNLIRYCVEGETEQHDLTRLSTGSELAEWLPLDKERKKWFDIEL